MTLPAGTPMLTARQQEIWQYLAEYVDAHGYPPTVREIGDAVGLASPSTVHAHHADATQPSDAASPVHVTEAVTAERPLHHGCITALDEGTLDRPSVAAGLGYAPTAAALAALTPSAVPSIRQPGHAAPASRPGRASIPLRI